LPWSFLPHGANMPALVRLIDVVEHAKLPDSKLPNRQGVREGRRQVSETLAPARCKRRLVHKLPPNLRDNSTLLKDPRRLQFLNGQLVHDDLVGHWSNHTASCPSTSAL